MQLPQMKLPSINTTFIQTVPSYFRMPQLTFGKSWSVPRIEASLLLRPKYNQQPVLKMIGTLKVKNFNFKKSLKYAKEAPYAR